MPTPTPPFLATCLTGLLHWHAQQRPDACAIEFEGQRWDYAALAQRSLQAAQTLAHHWAVRHGDRVAYLGLNHADQLVLLFACAHIGAILVPLNFRLAAPEWDALLADCTPCCVVADRHWQAAAGALAARAGIAAHPLADLFVHNAPAAERVGVQNNLAPNRAGVLLVYTSGTTGLPKGALHTQDNLLANMALSAAGQGLTATDTVASMLPLFHVGGLCIQTLPALYVGACVHLHSRFDAGAALRCFANDRPTLTLQVPATLRALAEHPDWSRTDLSSLRAVWAGSSNLPAQWVGAFARRGIAVCNIYGATETGPFSIALPKSFAVSHAGSCGWPAHAGDLHVQVKLAGSAADATSLADEAGLAIAADSAAVGEICIRAPNVAQRYWPDRPAVDADGFFHTGDLARRAPDGSYTIIGRAKDMLISGGENIYPVEIENILAQHSDVADCAVLGLPDALWGQQVVACVVLLPSLPETQAQAVLQAFLALQLAGYKLPRRYVWLASLPKTALGKVQKHRLLAQLQ